MTSTQQAPQAPPTAAAPHPTERIYIGGLDPSRGLTVDLVASRLRSVPSVQILSVNDAPLHDKPTADAICGDELTNADAEGDVVDTRRFFFLEARRIDASSSTSALQLLAKQYHNSKWKGCQLRVEEAKPHFLQRLEMERVQKEDRRRQTPTDSGASSSAPVNEEPSTTLPSTKHNNRDEQPAPERNVAEPNVKQRRRLRIRRRFGQEAYHVDAHPQLIEMPPPPPSQDTHTNGDGWDRFSQLYRRMAHKRQSQWMKLMERRKEERRVWSQGHRRDLVRGERGEHEEGLKGFMFLNRAIHIRFRESNSDVDVERGEKRERRGDCWREADVVSTSSSSSSSEENESEDHDNTKGYVWSDEEEEDAGAPGVISSEGDESESNREERNTRHEYVWSEEESDEELPFEGEGASFGIKSNMGMEEFSGGMDFHDDDDVASTCSRSEHTNDDSDENASRHGGSDEGSVTLEDDIRSNLGILSKLFPKEKISVKPLADVASTLGTLPAGNGDGIGGVSKVRTLPFGGGLIMQRYDPRKEDGAMSEKKPAKLRMDEIKHDVERTEGEEREDQEECNDGVEEHLAVVKEEESIALNDSKSQDKSQGVPGSTLNELDKFKISQDSTRYDIYEQDKLENIFKQAREQQHGGTSASTGFSFGALFESQLDISSDPLMQSSNVVTSELQVKDHSHDAAAAHAESNNAPQLEANEPQRQARMGLRFPQSVLDEYENFFFSLDEGPRIIADLESVRNDKEVQDHWLKEREVLTADWKRKQKAALSRKLKKVRRF